MSKKSQNHFDKTYKNGVRFVKNGWTYVSIKGSPLVRGEAHGYLLAKELKEALKMVRYVAYQEHGETWEWFIKKAQEIFRPYMEKHHQEYLEEMKGIAIGATKGGTETSQDEILAWNAFFPMFDYWYPNYVAETSERKNFVFTNPNFFKKDRCSAFIATGSYTKDGKIVLAHNTFDEFVSAQHASVMLNIKPDKGHEILMQTMPGWIWSGSDFYVSGSGIVCAETTIGGFLPYITGNPVFCRIRKAIQYAKTLNECKTIMLEDNTGGYANSWLFGDTNTNQIMRLELGLKYHSVDIKKDGYFIGFNAPYDPKIRLFECHNTGFYDIRRHQGARRKRLTELMAEHKGEIDVEIGKKILADHYDVYLKKINPCSRTVDSHYDLDAREYMSQASRPKPYQPRGALDGKVTSALLAKQMALWGRWGNSSGMAFSVKEFLKKNSQWDFLKDLLYDRPSQPWVMFKSL